MISDLRLSVSRLVLLFTDFYKNEEFLISTDILFSESYLLLSQNVYSLTQAMVTKRD